MIEVLRESREHPDAAWIHGRVREALPPVVQAVRDLGAQPVWLTDPMHGNTFTSSTGHKTRRFDDVVDVTLFMIDPDAIFETVWPVLGANWGEKPYPNITAVGVTWLAGFDFEIKVIARLPDAA